MGNTSFKSSGLLTSREMKDLHRQILFEYPFLSNVYESMLLTDNTKEDCPIVFANDQFEVMTLYSKEEILGKNCRFLQGRYTDRSVVQKIRYAVDNSLPIDVEILNYRKDGVAFWNAFLMLPVHKKGTKEGRATHFLAIQKDTTPLKEVGSDPLQWTPPEVAMWLEKNGMGQYGKSVVETGYSGASFLNLGKSEFRLLGITDADIKKLSGLIKPLHAQLGISQTYDLQASSSSSTFDVSRSSSRSIGNHTDLNVTPNQKIVKEWKGEELCQESKENWNSSPTTKMALKCTVDGSSQLLLCDQNIPFVNFQALIEKSFGPCKASYFEDGYQFELSSEKDLRTVMALYSGQTLPLHLEKIVATSSSSTLDIFIMLKHLPIPILIMDLSGIIHYVNVEGLNLLGYQKRKELIGRSILDVCPAFPIDRISKFSSSRKVRMLEFVSPSSKVFKRRVVVRESGTGMYSFSIMMDQ